MNLENIKEMLPEGHIFINTFVMTNSYKSVNVQHTNSDNLGDVVSEFRSYLRACGFSDSCIDSYITLD